MKKIKKTIAYLFTIACCFAAATTFTEKYIKNPVVTYAEEQTEKIYGNYSYVVYDKIEGVCDTPCVEITKYNAGEQQKADIPAEIDGLPVVSMASDTFKETSVNEINIPSSITHFGEGFTDNLHDGTVTIDGRFEFSIIYSIRNNNKIFERFSLSNVYTASDENTIEDIEIPETVFGIPVTEIDNSVFSDNENIGAVKIPDTVRYFGKNVFSNSSVKSVNIPKSLLILPSNTFEKCSNLEYVDFHENMFIGKDAFCNSGFKIPDSVKLSESDIYTENSYNNISGSTGEYFFSVSCNYLLQDYRGIIIYDNMDYLLNTPDIVVPEYIYGVLVTSVTFNPPPDVYGLEINLNSMTFPSGITNISNYDIFNFSMYNTGGYNPNPNNHKVNIRKVIINGNTTINHAAFKKSDVEEVVINNSCMIDTEAFSDCEKLKKVEFTGDNSTITIGQKAFQNCTALEEIIFPENMTADIRVNAFEYCSKLKELTVSGNSNVASQAFSECNALEKLTIKGDVTLSKNAFSDCHNLTDIVTDTGKPITGNAFNGCVNLVNINSTPVFDTSTNSLYPEVSDFVLNNFNNANDVGFINLYVKSLIDNIIAEYITDDMTDMQKAKVIHDWVCNNTVYDQLTYMEKNHNDASVFMNDSSVCEGYARCYNLLLNAAGIESYFLLSNSHAWNIIKLDGHYFHSDTTWDDGETISHDWFLKSDEEMRAETSSHASWKLNLPSSMHNFQKETLPECKYRMGDINTDGDVNVADLVVMNKYLTGNSSVNVPDLTSDGVVDVFDLVCMRQLINQYLVGQSSTNNIAELVVMNKYLTGNSSVNVPDLTSDGVTDVFDMVCMRQLINQYLAGQSSISTDDIVLADLTYDGVIDAFDLILMRKLILNK